MASTRRRIVGYKRMRLGNGRYLMLAITDEPGPRGGHTIGQVRTRKDGAREYPGYVEEPASVGGSANRRKRKHGRHVTIKRKGG